MAMLGARASVWADDINEEGAVSGLMEKQDGVRHSHSTTLSGSVATAQHDQAEIVASRNFQCEWDQSIGDPISNIGHRFRHVKVSGRPVVVTERVGPALEKELHEFCLVWTRTTCPGSPRPRICRRNFLS